MPQFSTCLDSCVSPWGWPDGLVHNSRILRTSFFRNKVPQVTTRIYKNALQASEALQPYFKESKGISCTSLRCGFLTRFAVKEFFSYESLNARNQEKLIPTSYLWGIISYIPQPRIPFFCSQVAVFTSDPSRVKYWLLHFLFYEEAMCKGSTGNGLLYATKALP